MREYIIKGFVLDAFLQFNEYEILKDAGKVSAKVAKELAEGEYEKFRVEDRLYESDFDREVKKVLSKGYTWV
ncbi:MAG: RhuM family protein [Tepidanaerobacteraceae bacterium]